MVLHEYERIARSIRNSGPAVLSNIPAVEESAATHEVAALYSFLVVPGSSGLVLHPDG